MRNWKSIQPPMAFVFLVLLSGCSAVGTNVPVSVEPLWASDPDSGRQLCKMYDQYGLLVKEHSDCAGGNWRLKQATPGNQEEAEALAVARNELQHAIFHQSNILCKAFKDEFVRKSMRGSVGSESLSILLSAGAVATGHATVAKSLAAAAGASNAVSGLLDDRYVGDADTILLGIEAARTDIFKKTAKGREQDVFEYPINQAVNDAIRYHSVCNMIEGQSAAESAARDAAEGN